MHVFPSTKWMNQVKRVKNDDLPAEPAQLPAEPAAPAAPAAENDQEKFKASAIHKARWDFVA